MTSPAAAVAPGQAGVPVEVTVANPTASAIEVRSCELRYSGPGSGFTARLAVAPEPLAPGTTGTVRFVVRFPADGSGSGWLDAVALFADTASATTWVGDGARFPWAIEFVVGPAFDRNQLPVLVVTTSEDELDGGSGLSDLVDAGGEQDLSLREALTIVTNLGQPRAIVFDPAIFGGMRIAPIDLRALGSLPAIRVDGTVVDGTGSRVRIENLAGSNGAPPVFVVQALRVALIRLDLVTTSFWSITADGADDLLLQDVSIATDLSNSGSSNLRISSSHRVVLRRVRSFRDGGGQALEVINSDDLTVEQGHFRFDIALALCRDAALIGNLGNSSNWSFSNCPGLQVVDNTLDQIYGEHALHLSGVCTGTRIEGNMVLGPTNAYVYSVHVDGCSGVSIRDNRLLTGQTKPIALVNGANGGIQPPLIDQASATAVAGTAAAPDGSIVDLYEGDAHALRRWLAAVELNGGAFHCDGLGLNAGETLVATVTDPAGNTSESTAPVGP